MVPIWGMVGKETLMETSFTLMVKTDLFSLAFVAHEGFCDFGVLWQTRLACHNCNTRTILQDDDVLPSEKTQTKQTYPQTTHLQQQWIAGHPT